MEAAETNPGPLDERRLRQVLDAVEAVVFLFDVHGRLVYVSPGSRRLLGYEPKEMVGIGDEELVPFGLAREAQLSFRQRRRASDRLRERRLVCRRDGTYLAMRFDATPVRGSDGLLEGVAITAVEAQRTSQSERGEPANPASSPAPLDADLIESLPAVVYIAEPGAKGRWHYVSRQIEAMLGYTAEEWTADPTLWAQRLHPDDHHRVIAEEDAESPIGAPLATEYRILARDSSIVWVRDEAVMRSDPDGVARYKGLLIDITERKSFESRLEYFADHDSLTGLLTRRRIESEIATELRRARRWRERCSILLVDIDDLKTVNDSCGHTVGDDLIQAVADVMLGRLRESDSVARLGGDEFVALLRGADVAQAVGIAKELVIAVGERVRFVTQGAASTGISIGVAGLEPARDVGQVLELADAAMYEAKRTGRGRVARAPSGQSQSD